LAPVPQFWGCLETAGSELYSGYFRRICIAMWIITVAAGLVGFIVVYFSNITISPDYGAYVSIAALAGLDAVIGGFRAAQQNSFKSSVFLSGFLVGVVLAVALTWFGERIGVEISLAAVFVFVSRIMQNLSIIRRIALEEDRFHMPHLPVRTRQRIPEPVEDSGA
jgi:small basic protein